MKKFLTESERSKILELRSSNVSIINISKEIHRGKASVGKFLNNPEEYIKEMEAYTAMAPKRHTPSKPANQVTLKKYLTESERAIINSLKSEGKSVSRIALSMGRGTSTIKLYLNNPDGYEDLIKKEMAERPLTKPKMPSMLSNSDRLKVLQFKKNGLSIRKIADKIRKSRGTIAAFLKNSNDYEQFMSSFSSTPKKNLHNKINGIKEDANNSHRAAVKRYLTEQEREKIKEMREQNNSLKTISKLMHRSVDTINAFLRNPTQYSEEVLSYEKLKLNRKSVKLDQSYKNLNDSLSEEALKNFNKVSIEYRSVIKYLVKKGHSASLIYDDLKEVYGQQAPGFTVVAYWAQQFEQGRQTIVNESKSIKSSGSPINGVLSNTGGAGGAKKPPVKVKLFQFKFKPVKRLKEE